MSSNRVAQVKTAERDGYCALQVGFAKHRPNRVNKAMAGHFAKAGIEAAQVLKEFRVTPEAQAKLGAGPCLNVDMFKPGQKVDVGGVSQGKGFSGVIKRHHFRSNNATHGNSVSHNKPGSTGQCQSPSRVFPGKRMPGHHGAVQRTAQKLEVVRVDADRQLLLIKGAVPGAKGGHVTVSPSSKAGR
jgi:large subunit ribosomal protein L3